MVLPSLVDKVPREEVSRTLGGRGDRDSVESVQGGNEKDWEGTILGDIFKK